MVKKILWLIGSLIILVVAAYFIMMRFAPTSIPVNMPIIEKLTCPYPVKIAGNSMSPALPAGTRVTFDRCVDDKLNLAPGTVIAFQENSTVRISRIIEKSANTPQVIYKTSQDGRADAIFQVEAGQIVAVYNK